MPINQKIYLPMSKNYRNLVGLLVIYTRPQRASTQSQTSFSVYGSRVLRHRRVGRAQPTLCHANAHPFPSQTTHKTNALPRYPATTNPFLRLPTQSATLTNAYQHLLSRIMRAHALSHALFIIGIEIILLFYLHMSKKSSTFASSLT